MTISFDGNPSFVIQEVITSTVFAMTLYVSGSGSSKKGLSKGAVAGIVIGVILAFAIVGALIWILFRQRRRSNVNRRPEHIIEENHPQPPEYTAEKVAIKPALTQTAAPVVDDIPVSPVSSPTSSTRRKPVAANTDSMILSDEERALVESLRAEQAEKARRQRASELEEAAKRGEEIQGAEIHEVGGGRIGPSELEGRN
jgi:type IV secretory pathway VirB10-like protein